MSFHQAHRRRPDFQLCGLFNGKGGQSASHWLKKLEWELQGCADQEDAIPAAEYLHAVDILLTDEAVTWAETTLSVSELLEDSASTLTTVVAFKSMFTQKYPAHILETPVISFDSETADLRQFNDEPLLAYYKRTASLLSRVGEWDQPHHAMIFLTSQLCRLL